MIARAAGTAVPDTAAARIPVKAAAAAVLDMRPVRRVAPPVALTGDTGVPVNVAKPALYSAETTAAQVAPAAAVRAAEQVASAAAVWAAEL